jgi:hypothetical protein
MTIKNKIKIAGLVSLLSVLPAKEKIATISQARKILKTSDLEYLPGGYITDMWGNHNLINIAGAIAGTIDFVKSSDGCLSTGTYSQFKDPEALIIAAKYADVNKDKIITERESRNLYSKLCKSHMGSNKNE